MATDLFSPLTALHRPGRSLQQVNRAVMPISSPAGLFTVAPNADFPRPTHVLDLILSSPEEAQLLTDWYRAHLGALVPFWVPSYQQDLVPVETIAADDVSFLIKHCWYTELLYPSANRQAIIFLQPDGTFLKRDIISSADNEDGTETLTINEALGISFTQNNANGICFLWYARLLDDRLRIQWDDAFGAVSQVQILELLEPPLGGSGTGGPITGTFDDSED